MEQAEKKSEIIKAALNVDYYPITNKEELQTDNYTMIPFTEITTLGAGFSTLQDSFKMIKQTLISNTGGGAGKEGIYRVSFQSGIIGELHKANDGSGFLGGIKKEGGGLAQSRLEYLGNSPDSIATQVPIDPTMMFMAVALANINKKLDKIKETQQDILDFLKQDKEAKLKGDIDILTDISNSYKHNWNNDTYINLKLSQVQEIKRNAKHNTIFYQTQIEKAFDKKKFLHADQNTKEKLDEMQYQFINYKLTLYVYSFSSFLEVMLLGNFVSDYLDKVVEDIRNQSNQYQLFYTQCYNQIEQYAKGSVETKIIGGIAKANKFAGKTISKIPVISKTQVDESLIEASGWLDEKRAGKLTKTMDRFKDNKSSGIHVFIENIETVNMLYNQPMELLFDEAHIYLRN